MKKNSKLRTAIVAAGCVTMTGCGGCARVSAGYVGVKSTLTGTDRGLSDVAVGPAWVFYNPFTASVFDYPTFMQTAVWTQDTSEGKPLNQEITFTSKDSMQVSMDISLSYTLSPEKVPAFYLKFRTDDLDTFTHGFLRNVARDAVNEAAGNYAIEQIMGDNAQFIAKAKGNLQAAVLNYGVKIEQFGVIGAPRPPKGVMDSINLKVQANQLAQQKQNEVLQATADAQKAVAVAKGQADAVTINAEAQAAANRKLSDSLTTNFIEYQKMLHWDGHLPQVTGSNALINLGSGK